MSDEQVTWYTTDLVPCPGLSERSWHKVGIHVRTVLASIYIGGKLLTTLEPFHAARGQVGIMAVHDKRAVVYFRSLELTSKRLDNGACAFKCMIV